MSQGVGGPVLAWDASALHHAGRIDRLDSLLHLSMDGPDECINVTTAAVVPCRRGEFVPWAREANLLPQPTPRRV